MAIRDRAGAYHRRSLDERGKHLTINIGWLVAALGPAEAAALERKRSFIFVVCEKSAKKERIFVSVVFVVAFSVVFVCVTSCLKRGEC